MEDSIQLAAILLGPPVILLLGLAFTVIRDPYIRRDHKRVMLVIIALVLCLMAQNCLEYVLSYVYTQRTLRTISSIMQLSHSGRPGETKDLFVISAISAHPSLNLPRSSSCTRPPARRWRRRWSWPEPFQHARR